MKIVFSSGWESVDVEGPLSALSYHFYIMELSLRPEHLKILVFVGVLEPMPYRYQGTVVSVEGVRSCVLIFDSAGSRILAPALFTGQL